MRLIIEARVECSDSNLRSEPIRVAVLDRVDDDLEQLGLTLEEGRELLAAAQSALVASQAEQWLNTENYCRRCCTPLYHKDSRSIIVRTVFGKVTLRSPRFWSCTCDRSRGARRHTFSPLSQALPKRVTPELEYLQVKWAAHLPYSASTELLKEVLPLQECISATGAKTRIRTTGAELDAQIEREIAAMLKADIIADAAESSEVTDFHLRSNARFLVNYGARYRKGLPISSAIAESAVNQVVSTRMAKGQQMRWCDEGAHNLALVRVADLNGELTARTFGHITQPRRRAVDKLYYEPMDLAA